MIKVMECTFLIKKKILGEKYRQIGVSHDLDPPLFQINDRRK